MVWRPSRIAPSRWGGISTSPARCPYDRQRRGQRLFGPSRQCKRQHSHLLKGHAATDAIRFYPDRAKGTRVVPRTVVRSEPAFDQRRRGYVRRDRNGCLKYLSGRAEKQRPARPLLSLRLRTGPLEEVVQIPRHDAPGFYIGHSFVDGVLKRTKFLGLGQQIGGRRLPHFLG